MAALFLALFLIDIMIITVKQTAVQTIKAVANELMDIMYAVSVDKLSVPISPGIMVKGIFYDWVANFPVMFPQTTVCIANIQVITLVGTSIQVALVWLVIMGQLPQFDARML